MRWTMMQYARRLTCGLAVLSLGLCGCETSSHKSVQTYEYDGEPQPSREEHSSARLQRDQPPPVEEAEGLPDEEEGEWHMVAPGEMVSPGKPVVDPGRRNP